MQGLSQIRLYLEQNASLPETVESLKSQLAALRAQYPSVDFGSLDVQLANVKDEDWENNWKRYYQPLPSANGCWSFRSGCTRKTRKTASRSCSTPA